MRQPAILRALAQLTDELNADGYRVTRCLYHVTAGTWEMQFRTTSATASLSRSWITARLLRVLGAGLFVADVRDLRPKWRDERGITVTFSVQDVPAVGQHVEQTHPPLAAGARGGPRADLSTGQRG